MRIPTTINGTERELDCAPEATLLDALRDAGYKSVKLGCDCEGMCGACTVLLDGEPVLACLTPAPKAQGRKIETVEGLGDPGRPHPIQKAFVTAGAVQCGYCTPGMILATKSLVERVPEPSDAQIADALSGNLCRCTGYVKILDAVRIAADAVRKEKADGSN